MRHDIIIGDCLDSLAELSPDTFQTCITSPPYYGLRDYGVDGQIGLEDSLSEHISALVDVFRAVRRVLRPDGTLWMNYGDAYQDKQLLGLPWRLAFALQADGWWLRSDIIWHKPNPMPSSVTDRPTSSHEYMFLLSPSQKYFYDADAVREKAVSTHGSGYGYKRSCRISIDGRGSDEPYTPQEHRNLRDVWTIPTHALSAAHFATFAPALVEPCIKAGTSEKGCCASCGAPIRRIVEATGGTIGEAWHDHSDDLGMGQQKDADGMESYSRTTTGWEPTCDCEDAGEPVPCKVLDPFGGAGTVGLVADRLGRDSTLLELNPEYAELARKRLIDDAPLLCEVKIL
jgi:DNA modification methylase